MNRKCSSLRHRNNLYLILCALLALTLLSSSVAIPAAAQSLPGYSLTASPIAADRNETFYVTWTKPANGSYGFIGLYDTPPVDAFSYVDFRYPTQSGNTGVVAFLAPDEPGAYWVGWVSEGQVKAVQYVGVQLQLSETMVTIPGYSLSIPNAPVEPGGELVVNWVKPAGAGLGYIGIWDTEEDGEPGGGPAEGVGSYLDLRHATGGDSGSVIFIVPDEPGGYWLAWVSEDDAEYKAFVSFAVAGEGGGGPGDTEAPTVSVTSPADGASVSGTSVTVTADADDNFGVVGVQFQLDGVDLGAEVTSAPYSVVWNSATASNGSHVLTAVARDAAGNQTTSSTVTVINAVPLPGAFAKIGPANGAGGEAHVPTLGWGNSSGAASYEYCVDTTNNNACDASWTSTANTSVIVTGLNAGTTYFWQVRARNTAGTVAANGNVWWSFTTTVSSHVNVASASNGAVASASSFYHAGFAPSSANNDDRKGLAWGSGGGWNDGTENTLPDWLQVDFAGPRTIDEVDVFTLQDDYSNPIDPTPSMTFTTWGITDFQIQYWDGLSWAIIPGGDINGNSQVWRQIEFGAITTTKIRIYVTGALNAWSRITEVEAYADLNVAPGPLAKSSPANGAAGVSPNPVLFWGASSGASSYEYCIDTINNNICDTSWTSTANTSALVHGLGAGSNYFWQVRARNGAGATEADGASWWTLTTTASGWVNVAAAANGGSASASSFYHDGFAPSSVINGDRKGLVWGSGGGWNDATESTYPDWLQVDFAGPETISEIDVFTLQDDYVHPAEPTLDMTFSTWGITDFQVQYWDGSNWVTVPTGDIAANNQVWRQVVFSPVTASRIRVLVTGSLYAWSRVTELEAYSQLNVAPGSLAKNSPSNGATGQALVPKLSWGVSNSATSYEYCVDAINNNSCDTSWTSTSNTSAVVGGLSAGTYFWQVRARNGAGATEADNGTWWTFATSSSVINSAANVASAANGATVSASSSYPTLVPEFVQNGERKGLVFWNDATPNSYPDFVQINFAGAKTISEIDVFSLQDNYQSPVEPTPSMTFTIWGITNFEVQYWDGSNWVAVPNGTISGNNLVWKRITFPALTTAGIRIKVTGALNGYSRITEVEAY